MRRPVVAYVDVRAIVADVVADAPLRRAAYVVGQHPWPGVQHVPLGPPRAGYRYPGGAVSVADRVYDTLRALHATVGLDEVEFADPAAAFTTVRAQRLLGHLPGVRLVVPPDPAPDGAVPGSLDEAVDRHLADYSRRWAARPPGTHQEPAGLVSVLIPVRDDGRYLKAAVDSVRDCGYAPVEIVVVDDGSTDPGTLDILAALTAAPAVAGPSLTVVRQPHRGLAAARNTAIAAARGRYLLPLDADDLLPPGFVAAAVDVLRREPGVACVSGDVRNFGVLEHVTAAIGYVPAVSLVVNTFARATAVFRAEAVTAVGGYDVALPAFEDWDLYLRLHKSGRAVESLPAVGHLYRRHHDSMTFRQSEQSRIALTQRLLRAHADLLTGDGSLTLLLTLVELWKRGHEPSASVAWRRSEAQPVEHVGQGNGGKRRDDEVGAGERQC